jgi:hypothetical protein
VFISAVSDKRREKPILGKCAKSMEVKCAVKKNGKKHHFAAFV